jgi:hypothetical protein
MNAVLPRYPDVGFIGYQAVAGDEKVALSQDDLKKIEEDRKNLEKEQKKEEKKNKKKKK